jgi:hypothetical protein
VVALQAPLAARAAGATETPPPRTSSLSWIRLPGAEPCVSAQDLARDVETRLGHPVFVSPSQADVSVEGHIERAAGARGWHAVLVLRDADGVSLGTRELRRDDPSCDAMRAPLALIIVVMIDPDAALSSSAQPAAAPPPPPPLPAPPVVVEKPVPVFVPVTVPPPPRPPSWHLDVGTSLIGGVGLLPGPSVGLAGGGVLVPPPGFLGFEVYGALWLDQTLAAGTAGSATLWLGYVGGGLCPLLLRYHRLDASGCASAQLGYLAAYGPSSTPNQSQIHVAGALEARGTLRLAGPFTARAGALVLVPVIRDSFFYEEAGGGHAPLFQMAPVAATLDLGVGVAFP